MKKKSTRLHWDAGTMDRKVPAKEFGEGTKKISIDSISMFSNQLAKKKFTDLIFSLFAASSFSNPS